ncbi:hypothetical protein RN347_10140 [Halomonas sp. PAMB 3264]|uniref:hypothetical protein n=1 Tax=Halomonas sp. PAMB 3264 TaxID=3075222 RepID=UPI0028994E6B|nr:hypothetical protein [Halomonas sp. PAMB 3264]WNL40995.1 hypothetical protein RN347_10140 [Halomonas sp. PAMB 3264]
MDLDININAFALWIAEILRFDLEETKDSFLYAPRFSSIEDISLTLTKEKLESEVESLKAYDATSETVLSDDKSYEILVREEGHFHRFLPRSRGEDVVLEIGDPDNRITYTLGRPSNQFCLYLIKNAAQYGEPRALSRPGMPSLVMRRVLEEQTCVLELVKKCIAGRLTLKLTSETKKSVSEFDKFSSAFLFNITYNTDTSLVQQRDFDELLRTGRITRSRRSSLDEIDPPRRTYIPDLIHHYQLAVGTENPMLEYISYYHIVEHFFESIFNEALVETVRNKLTHPDFSYKRKKDISSLIKDIAKSIKMRDDSMTFSEQEGLRLTLVRHVDLADLNQKLNDYDDSLVSYYKTSPVAFSSAPVVDLEGDDEDLIFKNLAGRIYKNRNSIVHSKESEKSKYMPFRDDKTLVKDVPLIRFISEQIIFATSSVA